MIKLLIAALVGYCIIVVIVFFAQRALLYFPTPASAAADQHIITLQNGADLQLQVYDTDKPDAVIYFGGNAEAANVSAQVMQPQLEGYAQYYLNYPGYGGSGGQPTEKSLFAAADRVFEFVAKRHQRIVLIGRSLGSGVAVYLASKHTIDRLVLITPFDSITEVATTHYPILPVRWLIRDRFDSLSRATQTQAPTLFLAAQYDRIIPAHHSESLFRAWPTDKAEYISISNADHNDIHLHPSFEVALKAFLARSLELKTLPRK